jgi:hypothetical protein
LLTVVGLSAGCGRLGFELDTADAAPEDASSGAFDGGEGGGLDGAADAAIGDECPGISQGAHDGTVVVDGQVALAAGRLSGIFTAATCDAGEAVRWVGLRPLPSSPWGKPLSALSESGYPAGNHDARELRGLWHLDGPVGAVSSGASIGDDSEHGNAGRTSNEDGAGLAFEAGVFGTALALDGVDDFVEIPGGPSLETFETISVHAWIRTAYAGAPAVRGRVVVLWETADDLGNTFMLSHFSSGNFGFHVSKEGVEEGAFDPADQRADEWHHLVGVYDGSEVLLYVDGALAEITSSVAAPIDNRRGPMWIGQGASSRASPVYAFDGAVDEVAVWGRALTPSDARELYERGVGRLRYQVRVCDQPSCDDGTFVGPDGTPSSWFQDVHGAEPPTFALSATSGRYAQWRAELTTLVAGEGPKLFDATLIGEVP